ESEDEKARFSTGFLKVTPAHDPDDWEIGQRHGLDIVNVMAPDGTISDKYGWEDAGDPDAQALLGMDRFEAREAVVEWFRQENLLEEVREYTHEVGHSYRSHVPIEPYLAVKKPIEHLKEKFGEGLIEGTDVPVNSLAGLALKPLLDGRLRFIPERYAKTYQAWLENLRDWPISRQLWWGHRIPIWSKSDGQECSGRGEKTHSMTVDSDEGSLTCLAVGPGNRDIEKKLEAGGWKQDKDVLDTWFSSALWPFSTMGWPNETPELKMFYPGDVLCTAREIITLWVSRMVMMGQYCVGDIPFSDVFIHAMIQDGEGRKMSKSLGNGIDPLIVIGSHGADAMRFTLASMTTQTCRTGV
ncbi:MAG: class I tRNA ligase family protein, partial [Planctomycetota bacterium]